MDALRALFQEIVLEKFYEKIIFFFDFFDLLQLFIFSMKVISNFFFKNCPLINYVPLTRLKKNKMELELRIRKEKMDGRFSHEDQSVSNNKRK